MKKLVLFSLLTLLLFSMTACHRSRLQNKEEVSSPTTATAQPAATEPEVAVQPSATMASETSMPAATEISPTQPPAAQEQPSAAATISADLDATLNELEQLLGSMDTDVNVP
jgi:hypothetical protein